ncbi:MAG: CRISPR system precrRNA processing endoribonuclease RAMP protein Cas6 [Candidatus Jordarchaeales archaeon]
MILRCVVEGEFIDDFSVPRWTGSALRGVFGHVLRRMSCSYTRRKCDGCDLRGSCLYYFTFETSPEMKSDAAVGTGLEAVTRPFTFDPLEPLGGRLFRFALNLIGERAVGFEAVYFFALANMGELGIGRDKMKNERRRFKISRVAAVNDVRGIEEVVYDGKEYAYGSRSAIVRFEDVRQTAERVVAAEPRYVTVNFETPTMLVYDGRVADRLDFHMIIRNLARRYSLAAEYLVRSWRPLSAEEAKEIIDASAADKTVDCKLKPSISSKFSLERLKRERYGPFYRGTATYMFPDEFWRSERAVDALTLLALGRYMHVGKLATAGYGKISFAFRVF